VAELVDATYKGLVVESIHSSLKNCRRKDCDVEVVEATTLRDSSRIPLCYINKCMSNCLQCNNYIHKQDNKAEKYKKKFCNSACAAVFNNKKRTKVDLVLTEQDHLLQSLIKNNTPGTIIAKELGISYDSFKSRFPEYKVSQKKTTCTGSEKRFDYYTRLEQKALYKKEKIFNSIERIGRCQEMYSKQNQKKWLKKYLIEKYGECCSQCKWAGKNPVTGNIMIEIDHIDGNNNNNIIENVRLLCPNCHSLTPTYKYIKRE